VIYPVDRVIQPLNYWGLTHKKIDVNLGVTKLRITDRETYGTARTYKFFPKQKPKKQYFKNI